MATGEQEVKAEMEERSDEWDAEEADVEPEDAGPGEPDLEWAYGTLKRLVRMVADDYTKLLMLDAPGGIGKTYNIKRVLDECAESDDVDMEGYFHQAGFTTPVELFKSLYKARHGAVIFLDDMSGITSNTKAVNMLKAATDTEGDINWVEYSSSKDIEHPETGEPLPSKFPFRGKLIMSFNDTPDNRHFNALKDRGQDYELSFSYDERMRLITEIAKTDDISSLNYEKRLETVDWIKTVTDPSIEVSIRTFNNVLEMREFSEDFGTHWEKDALEVFNLDYQKYLIVKMRRNPEEYGSIEEQVAEYKDKTGMSERHYYDKLSEVASMMDD